ncbi:MAG: DUF4433 domain-containing protein [Endomicrobium sp.]|nr:DUF4433 domain-containing protein [Endomicrobium sp.]
MKIESFKDIKIYRMTHMVNISHILKYGITHKSSKNANHNYHPIGDTSLIDKRNDFSVNVSNGENNVKGSIILGDFIPFYFGIKMPMLYVIQHGGNFVEYPILPQDIVYMVCYIENLVKVCNNFYFPDGHATDCLSCFYDSSKINDIISIINWDAITRSYWAGTDNLDIKRQKQAEFLIAEDVPYEFISYFGCYNLSAKENLIQYGVNKEKIKIVPEAYY